MGWLGVGRCGPRKSFGSVGPMAGGPEAGPLGPWSVAEAADARGPERSQRTERTAELGDFEQPLAVARRFSVGSPFFF